VPDLWRGKAASSHARRCSRLSNEGIAQMSRAELVSKIAQILEPWAWETKSWNATCARDDATAKAEQIADALAEAASQPREGDKVAGALTKRADECRAHAEACLHPAASSEYRAKEAAFREAATIALTQRPPEQAGAVPAGELLPCPFCGGPAEIQMDHGRNTVGVGCTKCATAQLPSWDIASKSWAIRAWNSRLSAAPTPPDAGPTSLDLSTHSRLPRE